MTELNIFVDFGKPCKKCSYLNKYRTESGPCKDCFRVNDKRNWAPKGVARVMKERS